MSPSDTPPPLPRPAELARERRLRDDPMAVVHGPLFVSCKRCGSRIKLSPKSSYDPFHWMKHRERCLRKPLAATRRIPHPRSPKQSSASSSATPPPLTPDDDRSTVLGTIFRDRSLSPDLDLPTQSVVRALDSAFLDRVHSSQRSLSKHVPLVQRWQTWNWSELRHPAWFTDYHILPALGNEVDYGDDDGSLPYVHVPPRTRSQDAPLLPA